MVDDDDDNKNNWYFFDALVCRFYGQGYIAIMDKVLKCCSELVSSLSTEYFSAFSLFLLLPTPPMRMQM